MRRLSDLVVSGIRSVPGMPVAATGLALALFVNESSRLTSYRSVSVASQGTIVAQAAALAVLVALAFVYRAKPTLRIHRQVGFGIGVSVLYMIAALATSGKIILMEEDAVVFVADVVRRVCEMLLLLQWAEALVSHKARAVGYIFALAVVEVAAFSVFIAFLKDVAAGTIVASLAPLSFFCLYWFRAYYDSMEQVRDDLASQTYAVNRFDESLLPLRPQGFAGRIELSMYVIPVLLFAFSFGNVHYAWVPFQDGASLSFAIQIGAAVGTLLGGIAVFFLVSLLWGRNSVKLCGVVILLMLMMALYLTVVVGGDMSFLYVVPLNVSQKLMLFLVWMSPFVLSRNGAPLVPWIVCMVAYGLGRMLMSLAHGWMPSSLHTLFVAVAATALILIYMVELFMLLAPSNGKVAASACGKASVCPKMEGDLLCPLGQSAEEQGEAAGVAGAVKSGGAGAAAPSALESDEGKMAALCAVAAKEYRLTRREEEVLLLLMQGCTAQLIAEKLVVSTSTAKTHIRNVYLKMDVHTQSEVILLVMGKEAFSQS